MPPKNRFRHQSYSTTPPEAEYQLVSYEPPVPPASPEFRESLIDAARPLQSVNLLAVYLLHGTFVGDDLLGLLTEIRRYWPGLGESLGNARKRLVDALMGETGNYTPEFAATLAACLSSVLDREVPVRLVNWSGQNNHIGRADGAIRLIAELAALAEAQPASDWESADPPRVMLWGHSHGGNVLALATNLLAADGETRRQFFEAAHVFTRSGCCSCGNVPVWQEVQELLDHANHPVRRLRLEVVTFGTPIRYGWDPGGYDMLLHFVNHRPAVENEEYLTRSVLHPVRLLRATDGDCIHQIGIAGSNFMPIPLAVRTLLADRRLHRYLQKDGPGGWLLSRMAQGQRVPEEGTTLLVDYGDTGWNTLHHLAGHGGYTRRQWLPLHLKYIARHIADN